MENVEVWKVIPNFSLYEVSDMGNIRSLNYKRTGKIKNLKPSCRDGYPQTMLLCDDGKYKTQKIHRLVAITFFGLMENLEVNHKNGITTDNSLENLEWCTHRENVQHSFDIGLQKPKRGSLNGMAKLTEEQVAFARKEKKEKGRFWGRNELAKQFGITAKHLQKIVNSEDLW